MQSHGQLPDDDKMAVRSKVVRKSEVFGMNGCAAVKHILFPTEMVIMV